MKLAIAAAAVVLAAFFGARLHDHERCEDARRAVFTAALGDARPDAAAIERIRESCRGTTGLISVVGALHGRGDDARAAPLAREAARQEPDNAAAWRVVAATAQSPAEARAAARRVAELDPLGAPARER